MAMSQAVTAEAAKGAPAVAGALASAATENPLITLATAVYILCQVAYLLRKWWREEKDWRAQRRAQGIADDSDAAPLGPK